MPKRAPILVDKPLALRLWELCDSLRLVRDAVEQLRYGHAHYFLALAGQLRLLLTDRSKGITPLLFHVGELFQRDISVFHGRTLRSDEDLRASGVEPQPVIFALTGFPVGLTQEMPEQRESSLREFLVRPIVKIADQRYSTADLIEFFANSAGGAHSPGRWSKELASLYSIRVGNLPALMHALTQIAVAVLAVGKELLSGLVGWEIHLALVVEEIPSEREATILSTFDKETGAKIELVLDPFGRLLARLRSIHGFQAGVALGGVDWKQPHHIALFTRLTHRLETELVLVVDDERGTDEVLEQPFLMPMERERLRVMVNRSPQRAEDGTSMGLLELLVFSALQGFYERAEKLLALKASMDSDTASVLYLPQGTFMEAEIRGSRTFGGVPSHTTLGEMKVRRASGHR